MRIVVLSPHRGDAAFSLGLTIDHWLDCSYQVAVMNCFTQSAYAPYSDVESLHPNDRVSFASAVRRREDIAWNKLAAGNVHFHDLDLLDAPLRLACSVDEVLTADVRPGDRAVARLAGAVAKMARTAPAGTRAFAVPLGVGAHIDHRVARQASIEALTDPAIPLAFYEDLPYAARPGTSEALPAAAEGFGMELQPCFCAVKPVDAAASVRRKSRIAQCYDSQVDSEDVSSIAEFCTVYGGRERLWVNAAWQNTTLCTAEGTKA